MKDLAAEMTNRIISFSLFGDEKAYLDGAFANCDLANQIYPDWICRIYVSDEIEKSAIDKLKSLGAEIVVKRREAKYDGLLWRFLPAGDRDLDAMIVRDIDSRLSLREKAAVDDWLASGLPLHIIRDHPNHRRLIPAGLWGCRGNAVPDMRHLVDDHIRTKNINVWDTDANFLDHCVYPKFLGEMFVHSEFQYFTGENPKQIPVARSGDEYLGFPPGRGEVSSRRLRFFREKKGVGSTELPLPEHVLENATNHFRAPPTKQST